jgi:hypothetical protein
MVLLKDKVDRYGDLKAQIRDLTVEARALRSEILMANETLISGDRWFVHIVQPMEGEAIVHSVEEETSHA